jgi:hypothetical protein
MKANRLFIACVAALSLAACGGGNELTAALTGGAQKPNPVATSASGNVTVTVDKDLEVKGSFQGLTANATRAHIHGPIGPDGTADPYCTLNVPSATSGSIAAGTGAESCGDKEVSEAEKGLFEEGKMYVNIHTSNNPNGEIRGDLKKKE